MNNRKAMYLPILYSSLKQERNNRVSNLLQVLEDKKQATEQNSLVLVKEWIWLVLFGFISIAVMISFYVVTRNRRLSILLAAYGLLWSISIVVQRLQLHRMYLTQVGWQQYADKRIWELKEDVKEYENQLATLSSQLESLIKTCQSLERKQEERREEWKHFLWEWKRWKEEWNESRVAVQIRLYQLDKWEERWTSLQSSLQELTNYHLTERRNWSEISQQLQTLSKQMNLQVSGENLPKSTDRNNVSGIVPWKQGGGEYNQLYSFSRDEFEREELLSQLDEEWMDAYWKERDSISPLLLESSKTISQLPQGMEEEEEGGKNKPIASIERLLSEEEKPLLSKQDEEAFKKETLILMEQIGIVEKSQVGRIIESTLRRWERLSYILTDDEEVFLHWGLALMNRARYSTSEEQEQQDLLEAGRKFLQASERKSNDARIWFNWGLSLCLRGSLLKGEEACQLFEAACEKYEKAIQLDGLSFVTRYNYGLCLYSLGTLLTGELAAEYLHRAVDYFESALDLEPSDEKTRKYLQKCQLLLKQLGIVPFR